jgi:hypothetical protein
VVLPADGYFSHALLSRGAILTLGPGINHNLAASSKPCTGGAGPGANPAYKRAYTRARRVKLGNAPVPTAWKYRPRSILHLASTRTHTILIPVRIGHRLSMVSGDLTLIPIKYPRQVQKKIQVSQVADIHTLSFKKNQVSFTVYRLTCLYVAIVQIIRVGGVLDDQFTIKHICIL